MAESSRSTTPSGFGPNQWLVDEMYERYQQDPRSVDKAWWEFFEDRPEPNGAPNPVETKTDTPPAASASRRTDPSTTKSEEPQQPAQAAPDKPATAAPSKPATEQADKVAPSEGAPVRSRPPTADTRAKSSAAKSAPDDSEAKGTTAKRAPEKGGRETATPEKKAPEKKAAAPESEDADDSEQRQPVLVPMRGASARTAANMDHQPVGPDRDEACARSR